VTARKQAIARSRANVMSVTLVSNVCDDPGSAEP
jgi:hypothetical protein